MSLINRVRNKSKELKEETNKITRKRLRAIVKDDRQVISKHYEGIDITENELLDHLRYRILRVSPILTPIITSRISRIDRDINIFSDGKVIYLGHNFFLNSEDYMMHHLLKQLGTIVTGMYMSSYYKTNDQDYQDFVRLVYLIIVEQIINTLMIKNPRILGMQQSIKSLVKPEYFANEVYENTTLKSNVYIQSFSTKKLQDLIEDTCVEHFENFMELRGNPDKKITFIVNMDFMGDSSQITLNGEALNKMRDIKQNLERTKSMEEHIKSLNLLRKTLKEQKEKEELKEQESSLPDSKEREKLEQEKREQQEREKQEQQEKQERQGQERQKREREKQEQQEREKQEQERQKLDEIEEQLRQKEWQEEDEENEIQSWGNENLEEEEEDQNIGSSISSLTPEEQVELMGQISASIPPAVYEEWVKRCIDQNSQSSRDSFNILRELLKEYGYTNEHVDMLDKHMPITNNNENISEAFKYKFDMNREDLEEDLTPNKLRETIEELIEENGLEELLDESDLTLDEIMEEIKKELEDIPNESESLEKSYEEEEDEEYKPKTLDQDGEIKPVGSEEGELDLDINNKPEPDRDLPEGAGAEAGDSEIEEMLERLKEEYGEQLVEEPEDLSGDEGSEGTSSSNTSSDGTSELEKSDETDTLGEALSTLDQIAEIDEEIEKITKILEEALNDEDINDMMTNETIITDSSISEQTTSDVVDLAASLDSDGEGHQDMLGAMVLTNRVADSYIDIKYHWYRELENFIKARKPNMNSSFSRPNKKYVHSGILLPSKRSSKLSSDIEFIRVFCDTSGSMSVKDIDILIGVIKKGEKMFPNKTEAFEFNNRVRKLKFNKGKLQDTLVGTGGTNIDAIFPMMSKRDTGKTINVVITDGGFSWRSLDAFLKKRKREIVVIILTNSSYYTELKASKSRYKVIMLGEDGEKVDINRGKIKGF